MAGWTSTPSGGTATSTAYGYDNAGNRTTIGGRTLTYDARNRLTGDGRATYAYSARGTETGKTPTGGTTEVVASDAFDRVITDGGQTYSYDSLDRVLSAATTTYGFAYSGLGNTLAADGATTYTRDPAGGIVGINQAGNKSLAWIDRHGDLVGNFTAGATALGDSVAYDPLGAVISGPNGQRDIGFQTGWTDRTTGKVNMAARWYDPSNGEFAVRDTFGNCPNPDSAGANRYAYGNADPLNGTDPTGHMDENYEGGGGGDGVGGGADPIEGSIDVKPDQSGYIKPGGIPGYGGYGPASEESAPLNSPTWNGRLNSGKATGFQAQNTLNQIKAGMPAGSVGQDPQLQAIQNSINSSLINMYDPGSQLAAMSVLQLDLEMLQIIKKFGLDSLANDVCLGGGANCGVRHLLPPPADGKDCIPGQPGCKKGPPAKCPSGNCGQTGPDQQQPDRNIDQLNGSNDRPDQLTVGADILSLTAQIVDLTQTVAQVASGVATAYQPQTAASSATSGGITKGSTGGNCAGGGDEGWASTTLGANGRVELGTACITRQMLGENSPATGTPVGWRQARQTARNAGFQGSPVLRCHVIGSQLGGWGTASNLVPCFQADVNTGRRGMRGFEDEAADAARAGMAVSYKVIPVYNSSASTVPVGIEMMAMGQYDNGTLGYLNSRYIPNSTVAPNGAMVNLGN